MIPHEKMYWNEQTFTWVDNDGKVMHVAVDRLNSWLWELGDDFLALADMVNMVKCATEQCGAHLPHAEKLPAEAILVPVTVIWYPYPNEHGGHHVLVDGAHRVIKRASLNLNLVPAYIVPPKVWTKFTLSGMGGDSTLWNAFNSYEGRYEAPRRDIPL